MNQAALNPAKAENSARPLSDEGIYTLKSDKLTFTNNRIYYSKCPEKPVKLDEFYIPPSASSPNFKALSDDFTYVNTTLALCDLKIRKSKNSDPDKYALNKSVTAYFNLILFLRSRGVYRLKDATQEDMQELAKRYAENGWKSALDIDRTVSEIIKTLDREMFAQSINFKRSSDLVFDSLRSKFWRMRVGFKPKVFLTEKTKSEFEKKAVDLGYAFSESWEASFKGEERSPTNNRMRTLMGHMNHLYYLPNSVDKLTFLPFENTHHLSKKVAKKKADRTANLGIEAATHLLGKSMEWIYNYGPKLITILKTSRENFKHGNWQYRKTFLRDNNPFHELAKELGVPAPNVWMKKTSHSATQDYYFAADALIGALQGACAVAIAGFNARRSSEVCDREIGLRPVDLIVDDAGEFHRVNFYIEKSYKERHSFYVNRTTFDAINLLIDLKAACTPLSENPSLVKNEGSLFTCHFWTTEHGPNTPNDFVFSRARNQPRSLGSFLSFLDPEFKEVDLKSHMWRRFFALIYTYRYDHSDLQSLSQHLRHMAIVKTLVYVTDTDARKQSETINEKIGDLKRDKVLDIELLNSLFEENQELDEVIRMVKQQKFGETIISILGAEQLSGGFPRLVRKLYKSFSKELNFSQLNESEKAEAITATLVEREYECNPMPHGQCNAPTNNYTFGAKCSNEGKLEKEKASASFCQRCMFHSKNDGYVSNLRREISVLDSEIIAKDTPRYIKENAVQAKNILIDVIQIHESSARINAGLMRELVNHDSH